MAVDLDERADKECLTVVQKSSKVRGAVSYAFSSLRK